MFGFGFEFLPIDPALLRQRIAFEVISRICSDMAEAQGCADRFFTVIAERDAVDDLRAFGDPEKMRDAIILLWDANILMLDAMSTEGDEKEWAEVREQQEQTIDSLQERRQEFILKTMSFTR